MAFTFDNKEEINEQEITDNNSTFDEDVDFGGMRSKYEIRTLICYLFNSVGQPMDKSLVVEAIQKKRLANYFEISSCFDDLIKKNNIELVDEKDNLYYVTANGEMVAKELEVARTEKVIGHSLNAEVTLYADGEEYNFLKENHEQLMTVFIVSDLNVEKKSTEQKDEITVKVEPAEGEKCERCWKYSKTVG